MTKQSIIKILCLSLISVLLLTGCGSSIAQTKADDPNVLVIGVDDQFPPLGYRDENGEIIGFDIDLANAVAEKLGMELEVEQIDWAAKEMELQEGNVDAVWNGLTITPEREEQMLFTDPYLSNDQVVVVKNGSSITTIDDLAGKKVGLQKASTAEDALNSNSIVDKVAEVVSYTDNMEALNNLDSDKIDAVIIDSVVADWYVKNNDADYTVLEESLAPEQYGVAVAPENTELQEKLNEALNEVKTDGTGAEISEKWFGSNILV